jgi:hypothetical protein
VRSTWANGDDAPGGWLMATVISCAALLVSITVFLQSRRVSRRELLLKVHDQLLGLERQQGRRLLFQMAEDGRSLSDLTDEQFAAINHSLSQMNVLAYLHLKRYVPRRDVIVLWGTTAARSWQAATKVGFIQLRDRQNVTPVWPFFRAFANHVCSMDGTRRSL